MINIILKRVELTLNKQKVHLKQKQKETRIPSTKDTNESQVAVKEHVFALRWPVVNI